MRFATNFGLAKAGVALALLSAASSSAYAQKPADMPESALPQVRTGSPLGEAPAERFAACSGIADRQERERCIARETAKRNPATRSTRENQPPDPMKGDNQPNDGGRKSNER